MTGREGQAGAAHHHHGLQQVPCAIKERIDRGFGLVLRRAAAAQD
jgi:hypothetical protein